MKNKATQSKAWATVQIARHPERPQFLDYVSEIFTEFDAVVVAFLHENDYDFYCNCCSIKLLFNE